MQPVLSLPAITAGFLLLNLSSMLFADGPGPSSLFWPGNGFLLAMLLIIPRERRPALLALAAPALVAVSLAMGIRPLHSLGFAAVFLLEFLLVLRMLRTIPGGTRFLGDQRGIVLFFLPVTATAAAGALAGGFLGHLFYGGNPLVYAATWFVIDAASLAAVTPAVLAWTQREFAWPPGWRRNAEFAACLAFAVLVAYGVFSRSEALVQAFGRPMTYLVFPPMIWAAIRFGARGASTVLLAIYVLSAWYTSRGFGPYAAAEDGTGHLFLPMQLFPFVGAFCVLLPAVLFHAHRRTERDLRLREARFGSLWGSRLIGIFVSDFSGRILEANDTFLGMIRRTRAELEAGAITSADMVTPEYLAGAEGRIRSFRAEGRMGPYDREWLLRDGSRLSTLFFATRLEGTDDALCMALDTGELKRARSELLASESRFKTLFDSNIVGVAVLRPGETLLEANDTFLAMIGYTREDLAAGRISGWALRAPDDPADPKTLFAALEETGRLDPRETDYIRKDGTRVSVYRGVARLDGTGRCLLIAIDITVLKRTQAELERAMAAARTASLAKSDFLAHMSHEIRTPLNGVLGTLALLQETRLDAEQQSYARTCRESGELLLALINQVLDFSRIESGALELDRSEFPLAAVLEGALAPLQQAAQKKGLELVKRIQPGLPGHFRGDPTRLLQILLNLVGNAVKFSERGEVSVSVRLRERLGDRCRLEFEIADTGPGIAPEVLATLFQPFRQGDGSLSRKAGGTGLGLAICKALAERMGGSIGADSRPGEGSRFRFDALLEAVEAPAGDPVQPEARAAGRAALVLEPHPDHREHLGELLAALGFRTLAADGPAEFLRAVGGGSGSTPDLAVLAAAGNEGNADWEAEAVAACRTSGVPVLCALPFIGQSRGAALLAAGAAGILAKPFRGADVRESLRSLWPERRDPPGREGPPPAAWAAPGWKTPPRVLVVDDHAVNLTVASSMLAKLGCRVETAPDGPGALEAVSRLELDLVLMDCQMPDMDGFEATRRLRALGAPCAGLPVIALTAHAVNGFRERCLAAGLDDYLSKPFRLEELAAMLRRWIPAGSRGVAGRPAPGDAPGDAEARMDWPRLAALGDGTPGGGERLQRLVDLFLDSGRASLEAIRLAHREDSRDGLARALHRLKGACGTLGATALSRVIGDLERQAESGPGDDFPEHLGELEREFSRTEAALRGTIGLTEHQNRERG